MEPTSFKRAGMHGAVRFANKGVGCLNLHASYWMYLRTSSMCLCLRLCLAGIETTTTTVVYTILSYKRFPINGSFALQKVPNAW